jgi:hypothetical protein
MGGRTFLWGVLLLAACAAASLVGPSAATAEKSSLYAAFTRCPTDAPEMNDPTTGVAACFSTLVRAGKIKLGRIQVPIESPMNFQFAVAGVEGMEAEEGAEGLEGEEGEGGESAILLVVPGSTSVQAEPFLVPNALASLPDPPASAASPPSAPSSPVQVKNRSKAKPYPTRRKRRRHKHHKRRQHKHRQRGMRGVRHLASVSDDSMIAIDMELLGDIRQVDLLALAGESSAIGFELPFRLHMRGEGLGPNCYIGSVGNPIVLAPVQARAGTSILLGRDPNGFATEVLGSGGARLEDTDLTIPAASGCGPPLLPSGAGAFDAAINDLIGLPAAAGGSRIVLADTLSEFAEAAYDGTAPDGGAELQAAFEAAQHEAP